MIMDKEFEHESNLQSLIRKDLKIMQARGIILGFIVITSGRRGKYAASRNTSLPKDGWADMVVFYGGGKTLHLELKSRGGKLRDAQKEMMKSCEALGHDYVQIKTMSHFLQVARKIIIEYNNKP